MKAFDFDGTLYRGDCTVDFFLYALRKNPQCIRAFPVQIEGMLRFVLGMFTREEWKESFYSFFCYIEDMDSLVIDFWDEHFNKLNSKLINRLCKDDVVISASPEFLLQEPCLRLGGLTLIASKVDRSTGRLMGLNCRGAEKVDRCRQEGFLSEFDEFYTDSYVDTPMTKHAKRSYHVRGEKIVEFNEDLG